MTLKRIELLGFKSFVGRTVLDFDHGISALVGPNGSGKSNVADAIRWVLGEQNPRQVRGKRAEDVIFAGSADRPPLGMAEASIVLDNADGRLHSEFSEVRISRRLYRSGESEYLVNGARSRLRDVSDVLMRVGLGPDSYSVIGQGAVDEMVLQRAEERRILLENAADVRRYRVQLSETTSRLASTEANLNRCQDVRAELEPLIRKLRQQAERAARQEAVQKELMQVSAAWFRHRFTRAEADSVAAEAALQAADAELRAAENACGSAEAALQAAADAHRDVSAELEDALGRISALEREEHRLQRLDAESRASLAELGASVQAHRRDVARLEERLEGIHSERAAAEVRLQEAASHASLTTAELARQETAQRDLHAILAARRSEADVCDRSVATIEASVAKAQRQTAAEQRAAAERQHEMAGLTARLAEREEQLERDDTLRTALRLTANAARERSLAARVSMGEASHANRQATVELSEARREHERQQTEMRSLEERVRLLQEVPGGTETEGARALQLAGLNGRDGLLASRIVVRTDFEEAIAAALGSALAAAVFEERDASFEALTWLARHADGRATLIDLEQGPLTDDDANVVVRVAQSVAPSAVPLHSVVQADREMDSRVRSLLSSTLVLPDAAAIRAVAAALHAEDALRGRAWILVTKNGISLDQRGVASAGRDRGTAALAARGRDYAEARARLQTEQDQSAALRSTIARREAEQHAAQQHEQAAAVELAAAEAEARIAAQQADEAERGAATRRAELEALRIRAAEGAARSEHARRRVEKLAEETLAAEAEGLKAAQAQRRARASVSLAREQVEMAAPALVEARAAHASASAAARAAEDRLQRLQSDVERAASDLDSARASVVESERLLAVEQPSYGAEIASLQSQRELAASTLERLRSTRELREREQRTAADTLALSRADFERRRQAREHASLAAHRSRDEMQRFARELSDFTADESILEFGDQPRQLRLELDRLGASDAEESADRDPEWLRRRMLQLQREARVIGSVDTSAAQEFREVSERYAFLEEQSADLERAMVELRGAMRELQNLATERLKTTFDAVNSAFGESFVALFGGGSASLALSDPDAPLESGVEVVARPPGKKLQPLIALSGGERSLTMIALLLALLKVTPTPFCVLDEVDAALDEANVGRFVALLRGFSLRTRFVVVTHNRATMEHADRLYGVTMDSSGISKAVVVALPPEADAVEASRGERSQQITAVG